MLNPIFFHVVLMYSASQISDSEVQNVSSCKMRVDTCPPVIGRLRKLLVLLSLLYLVSHTSSILSINLFLSRVSILSLTSFPLSSFFLKISYSLLFHRRFAP
ncbi:hypothetical protein RIF29_08074 [Crotalaria pallida]|uniref:Uncharacterized protein n=1 Tax=Crotalaria pallida TaxID=3830 RepID=A0AAN9PBQ5_CROPI